MHIFVQHNLGIERTVQMRLRTVPKKHLDPARFTVWCRREVGIVQARTVLRVRLHGVIAQSAPPKLSF
jgi:hypothetical protein